MAANPPIGGGSTGSVFSAPPDVPTSGDSVLGLLPESTRWLAGWLGTWFILSAMADSNSLGELATALAVSIAIAATFVLGPKAAKGLGV